MDIHDNNEIYHYGIPGMKWGVRRYQNDDGSLTPAGKARYAKEYKKYSRAGDKQLARNYQKLYVDSYNKTVDRMNKGLIDKFNSQQRKRYGKDYGNREGYVSDYEKLFNKEFERSMNQSLYNYRQSNSNYQKADALVKKYEMDSWDDLARSNAEGIREIKKRLGYK